MLPMISKNYLHFFPFLRYAIHAQIQRRNFLVRGLKQKNFLKVSYNLPLPRRVEEKKTNFVCNGGQE